MANQFGVALIFWAFYVSALALLDIFGYTDSPDENKVPCQRCSKRKRSAALPGAKGQPESRRSRANLSTASETVFCMAGMRFVLDDIAKKHWDESERASERADECATDEGAHEGRKRRRATVKELR